MPSASNSAFCNRTFGVLHLAENTQSREGSLRTGSCCLLLSVGAAVALFLEFDKGEGLASATRKLWAKSVQHRHKRYNTNNL